LCRAQTLHTHHVVLPGTPAPPEECLYGKGADIVIMVDTSGSIGPDNWAKMVGFLKALIAALTIAPDAYQIGIVP
jgi:hypothetical protein